MSDDVDEALRRARSHVARATLESAEAVGALLEATGRASGLDAEQTEALARSVARRFEAQIDKLRKGAFLPPSLMAPLEEALDREIARWEARSRQEPEARAVLRAFLGLRELLWELGQRSRTDAPAQQGAAPSAEPASARPAPGPRVQRFDVED